MWLDAYSKFIHRSGTTPAAGLTYYVDATGGNDANPGTEAEPLKTVAAVNALALEPGDTVLFKCGEVWRDTVELLHNGAAGQLITYGAYGSGNAPKFYGSLVPSSWTGESYTVAPTLAKVQGGHVGSVSSPLTKTFTNTPGNGNLLVAVAKGNNADSNASISGWTKAVGVQSTSSNYMAIFYKVAGASETKDVTLAWTGSTNTALIIQEWSGLVSPVLDKTASTATTGSGVTSRSSGTTATTTGTYEVLIAAFDHGAAGTSRSYTNSFTEDYDAAASEVVQLASRSVAATGAYETTQSWTTSRVAGGCIATFKGTETAKQLYYTAQSVDPGAIWIIDSGGTIHNGNKVATKDSLAAEYDWWWDDPNDRLYVYAATSPATRYNSVEVTDTTRNRGFMWQTGHTGYVRIENLDIAFITGNGIVLRGNTQIVGNHIHHLGNETGGHSYGIEIQTASNCWIANNTVHDTERSGIYVIASYAPNVSTDNVIELNTVYDCRIAQILISAESGNDVSSNTVRYNNCYHTAGYVLGAGYGFGINTLGTTGTVGRTDIYCNVVSVQKAAIEIDNNCANINVYFNTLKSTAGKGVYVSGTGTSGIVLKNNLLVDAAIYGLNVIDKTVLVACDYNLWYAPTGAVYARIGTTNYSAAQFATYKSDSGFDAHGLWEDPVVVSSSDLHLQAGSPARNAGVSIAGIVADYDQDPIDASPDIGALQY